MIGVAEKVTEVHAQTVVAEAEIETLTGKFGLTNIVMMLELAGLPVAQVAFEVRIHLTSSLFILV